MAIMLLPDQIPTYWEAIKFGLANAEAVKDDRRERYFNKLLYQLLAGKVQCFVRFSADRKLEMLGVTSIETDRITDELTLYCYGLYSFTKAPFEQWKTDYQALVDWANVNKCKSITAWATNPKAINIITGMGLTERSRMFRIELGTGGEL